MAVVVYALADLPALVGCDLGTSSWFEIDQARIDDFARVTGDHQWIHVDQERAASGPFERTIAHGYLVLSFVAPTLKELFQTDAAHGVNYGLNRVRFISPVTSGSSIRGSVTVKEVVQEAAWVTVTLTVALELRGSERPACVAEPILRYYR